MNDLTPAQEEVIRRAGRLGRAEIHGRGSKRAYRNLEKAGLVTSHWNHRDEFVRLTAAGHEWLDEHPEKP